LKSFKVQPFGQRVYVSREPSRVVSRYNNHAAAEDKCTLEELAGCRGMAIHLEPKGKSKVLFLLYLRGWDPTTLFHESLHMAHFLMEYCSAPINMESTEMQAYLMEHIADNAAKKLT
jgi:hypothetical protein